MNVDSLASQPGFSYRGYQVTDSETHPDWEPNTNHVRPNYDVGGEFFTQKLSVRMVNPSTQTIQGKGAPGTGATWFCEYVGPIPCTFLGGANWPGLPSIAQGNLNSLGATAIARCTPTNNVASAAAFLRELRSEGLPKLLGVTLWKDRTRAARAAGGEYLNTEFGWKPLVSDVKSIAFAATHSHEILSQYERDSGKVVRRHYGFPEEKTQSTSFVRNQRAVVGSYGGGIFSNVTDPTPPEELLFYGGQTDGLYVTRQTWKRVWFSGAFTYHLPIGYRARGGMIQSARHAQFLLGLDITPEVMWNTTPWTWALDWFSNSGDVVANLSDWATDGLVLKYGYVMEHSIATDTYFVEKFGGLSSTKARPSPIVVRLETKRRVKANPFGFGLSWDGLSPRQWAITVALGLAKGSH